MLLFSKNIYYYHFFFLNSQSTMLLDGWPWSKTTFVVYQRSLFAKYHAQWNGQKLFDCLKVLKIIILLDFHTPSVKVWWGPLNIELIWWLVTMHYDFEIVFYSIARKNLYCKESSRSFNLRSKFHFSKVFTCNASQAFTISKLVGKRIRLTTTWLRLYIIIYFCDQS